MLRQLLFALSILLFSSCVSHKKLVNFNEGPAFDAISPELLQKAKIRIQEDDLLIVSVAVEGIDQTVAKPFNPPIEIGAEGERKSEGYLVASDGTIALPVIGRQQVAGMTREEAKTTIEEALKPYLSNPIVKIQIKNFKITVLGEVNGPSSYPVVGEKITLFEALGMAGDLTPYANRENLLIVREQNGELEFGRVNLLNKDLFESPYYFLAQNDVIYVEPLKARSASVRSPASQILPWVGLATTIANLILIVTR